MTAWVVRAGGRGEWEEIFLSDGLAGVHFGLWRSVTSFGSRELLREHAEGRKAADQLWNFVHGIQSGDLIILPRKSPRVIAVGRMAGDYEYRDGLEPPHVRPVNWVAPETARAHFAQDLLNSIGGPPTVYRVLAEDAESRIEKIIDLYQSGAVTDASNSTFDDAEADEFRIDVEEQITDRIIDRIRQRFLGTKLEYLIAEILRASGYHALETRKGPDGGIDVLAGQGDMGFGHPRLCVQVKSGRSPVDIADYDRLLGSINTFGADHGLLVSLGDFTRAVRNRNESSFFQIRLWGPSDILDRLLETYDDLPPDIRSEIPLRDRKILIETEE